MNDFLLIKMETPTFYGPFHLVSLAIIFGMIFCAIFFGRRMNEKTYRITVFILWTIMVASEIFYQIFYRVIQTSQGVPEDYYCWIIFPFQFCSTPLYVLPFVALLPNGRVRDAFTAFCSSFVIFGGLIVCFVPDGLQTEWLHINWQAMFQHGIMSAVGFLIATYNHTDACIKKYLSGLIVFASFIVVAVICNEIGYAQNLNQFSFFFLSPYHSCPLPVLHDIKPLVSPAIFVILYSVGFAIIGFVIYQIVSLPLSKLKSIKWKRN